jgi:S-adenosylmethionine/arginine decarboxylase-like enzyme
MQPHQHLIIRSEIKNPIKETNIIDIWVKELIYKINMKILQGPNTVYCEKNGNRGLTSVTIIETSHIALHTWDEDNPALLQLDVYTCSKLNKEVVFDHLLIFDPICVNFKFLDREKNLLDYSFRN